MNKAWDIYMIGTLADPKEVYNYPWKESVFINKYDSLQFNIKLISNQPEAFPNNRYFTVYTSDLQDCQFEDTLLLSEEERVNKLKEFLSKRLLIFKPVQKGENFVVNNVKQTLKPKDYNKLSTYIPIPVFTVNNFYRTFEEFLNILNNEQFIDQLNGISNDESDTPSIIAWQDENGIKIIGSFNSHVFSNGKLKLEFDSLKYIDLDYDLYGGNIIDCPEIKDILFVGADIYKQMENAVSEGQVYKEKARTTNLLLEKEKNDKNTEDEFINNFINKTKEAALVYDEEDIINFHISMKSSNLVILSGMSGTGKSKLVQMYGEALGLDSSQLNIIPVSPSWSDDRDLLGYVDTIHNVYKPGDTCLIETLLQAQKNSDKMYIVCFDEMNLARVEYYFSQFLSILEMSGANRKIKLYNSNLENKLYNADKYPCEITIRDNILFVGTVNIDESTYHFSDKVLDRANVINLKAQELSKLKTVKLGKKVKYDEIMYNQYNGFRVNQTDIILSDRELELLNFLNDEINKTNKNIGIGFRIVKQIDLYLRNIQQGSILTREKAFDIQILQRVLTKIRGPQEQLKELLGTYIREDNSVEDSIIIELLNNFSDISSFSRSKKCIIQKAKELVIYGYTI